MGWFFALAAVVLMITLLALTTNREVSQSEFVVLYDTFNRKFDGVKEQGRYTTGVGVKLFPFQRTLQDLDVGTVSCLSTDKIEIKLDVKIQIRLKREDLIPLILRQFGDGSRHKGFMKHMASTTLVSSCLQYTVDDFFSDRSGVDRLMFQSLQTTFNEQDYGADVEFFQLLNIQLPPKIVQVITIKQNIEQELITATNDRANELIQATTELLEAEQQAHVILIEANNTARVVRNQATSQEEIIRVRWENAAGAYVSVKNSLDLDEVEFVDYLGAELYRLVGTSVVN
ncbi:unnamed protein product [Ectocarpus fasciculatus]